MRQATFAPITKIIKLKFPFLDADALGVKEMFDVYLKAFMKSKSGGQTGKNLFLTLNEQ